MPLTTVAEAFSKMLKNGWTWEPLRDVAQRPSTASHLKKFTDLLSNGALIKNLWTYPASA